METFLKARLVFVADQWSSISLPLLVGVDADDGGGKDYS